MEIDIVNAMYFLVILSLVIFALFWGSLTLTLFECFNHKEFTKRVAAFGSVTIFSGISMIILAIMLEPSFRWVYGYLGFTLK